MNNTNNPIPWIATDQVTQLLEELYPDVLKILEPNLCAGGIVASDNTDHDGLKPFLSHVRHPSNGYISSAVLTSGPNGKAHEISIRC